VEGNRRSLKDGAEAFMLFLRGAQLALRPGVPTVLDHDEVNVTLKNAEIFGSELSGEGGSASLWLAVLLRCSRFPSVAPCHFEEPPPFIASLLLFSFHGEMGATNTHSIRTAGGQSIFV
jgi:hypothetical protein